MTTGHRKQILMAGHGQERIIWARERVEKGREL